MRYQPLLQLLVSILLVACSSNESSHIALVDLDYNLTPIFESNGDYNLKVDINFIGDADGETEIHLGKVWGDERQAWKRFRAISVTGIDTALTSTQSEGLYTIKHRPDAKLSVSYTLSPDNMRNPEVEIDYFHAPVLQDNIIHLIGATSLAIPLFNDSKPRSVELNWINLPNNWSSIDTLPNRTLYPNEIAQQVFVAGETNDFTRYDNGLVIVKSGTHAFAASEFNERVGGILDDMNALWNDEQSKFLITLLGAPKNASYSSFSGTGRFDSFVSASTEDLDLDLLSTFLSHEVAHNWIPGKLGISSNCKAGECFNATRWFTEGFTDFVVSRAMISSGRWSKEQLINYSNQYLQEYYLSPARTADESSIKKNFWKDSDYERQPYWRGFILAMNWDNEISKASNGKKSAMDVLRAMKNKAGTAAEDDRPVLSSMYITEQFSELVGRDVLQEVEDHYIMGKILTPKPDWFEECAELKLSTVFQYDTSFDVDATLNAGVVSGVVPQSNAYRAGLRNKQILLEKVSGGGGDRSAPLVLKVSQGEKVFKISYIPISDKIFKIPQFEITKACQN